MRVCSGCEVLLPFVAFERKEAFAIDDRFYCKACCPWTDDGTSG
jgi:hypothetical protein